MSSGDAKSRCATLPDGFGVIMIRSRPQAMAAVDETVEKVKAAPTKAKESIQKKFTDTVNAVRSPLPIDAPHIVAPSRRLNQLA